MRCIILALCTIVLIPSGLWSQSKTTLPRNLKWDKVEAEFYTLLNTLRGEKKIGTLEKDQVLLQAAYDQSAYMGINNTVTHDQKDPVKSTPFRRVYFYGGTHDGVGENCIKVYLDRPMKTKYSKTDVTASTEKEIAAALFLGWKNSPGHYKNMIEPSYDVAGLGFYFNKDSSALYCAQVFSQKPYHPPKNLQSPNDAYGIKDKNATVCKCMETPAWREIAADLTLMSSADSVYLKSEKLDKLKAFFSDSKDAIYLDFVFRDQFVCANNNLLHGSPVYDGYMAKPLLFKDLFRQNRARGRTNFYACLGPIPPDVKKQQYGLDYGIVKQGYGCEYVYSVSIPERNLDILTLVPKWIDNPFLVVQPDTFNGTLNFSIPFERGKTALSETQKKDLLDRMGIYKPFVKSLRIKTFSSVEGSADINLKLQRKRAEAIKQAILPMIDTTDVETETESTENWNRFFQEIEHTRFEYMRKLDKPAIKSLLKDRQVLDSLENILKLTRVAEVEVTISAIVNNDSDPLLLLGAYRKSLDNRDSLRAFACQSRLISYLRKYRIKNSDMTGIEVPREKKFLPHLTNWMGLATNDDNLFYMPETRMLARTYASIDSNYLPMQFNYSIMALKYIHQMGDTIIPVEQLERKMQKCYQLRTHEDSVYTDYMFLNYNILTAYNNYLLLHFDKIDKPLQAIKAYYMRHELTETEGLKLGLLFNMYGRSTWTIEILYPMLKKHPDNQDLLFLYVQTYAGANYSTIPATEFNAMLRKAHTMNADRFYKWIDQECFQLLRRDDIKSEFCLKK